MKQDKPSGFPIFLSDVFFKFKLHKKKVKKVSYFIIGALVLFTLLSYPKYQSLATFKCGDDENPAADSLKSILSSASPLLDKPAPIAYFKSKRILFPVIEKLNLQGRFIPESKVKSRLKNLKDNLTLEYRFLLRKDPQPIPEEKSPLVFKSIEFNGKSKASFNIKFLNQDDFYVNSRYGAHKKGKIGERFDFADGFFVIEPESTNKLKGKSFSAVIDTKDGVYEDILKYLTVEPDDADPLLLEILFENKNNTLSANLVNELMKEYKNFLEQEQSDRNQFQLAYLNKRSNEVNSEFLFDLNDYANDIKSLAINKGYLDSQREIAHLSKLQEENQNNLLRIDNEIKRLKQFKTDDYLYCDNAFNTEAIRELLHKRRSNQQRIYSLELALNSQQEEPVCQPDVNLEKRYQVALASLENQLKNAKSASLQIEKNVPLDINSSDPHFQPELVVNWIGNYNDLLPTIRDAKENSTLIASSDMRSFYQTRSNLLHYFKENQNLLNIQLKNLSFKASSPGEFSTDNTKGVEPETSEQLYKKATEELEKLQKQLKKTDYVYKQLQEPEFPINSLSGVLTDNTSQDLIKQSTQLYIDLHDTNNFTQKERQRKHENIKVLRQSLAMHLSRLVDLMSLEQDSLQGNILTLQKATLDSSKQKGSILDASLDNIIQTRLESLYNEKKVLMAQNQSLINRMSNAPNTWVRQKALETKTEVNKSLLEEVSRLVETKNVQSNISLIDSRPLDFAYPPLYPKNPLVLIKSIFFAILSLSMCFAFFSYRVITKGPNAYPEYLKSIGQKFSGYLSKSSCCSYSSISVIEKLPEQDKDTFRELIQEIGSPKESKLVFAALNQQANYLPNLLHFLSILEKKALVIDFGEHGNEKSLEKYLEKEETNRVKDLLNYHLLSIDSSSTFINETLKLQQFTAILEKFKQDYSIIFFSFSGKLKERLAKDLHQLSDRSIITTSPELIKDMEIYLDTSKSLFIAYEQS